MKVNGEGDVIRIALNQFFNLPAARIFRTFVVQRHNDNRSVRIFFIQTVTFCVFRIGLYFFQVIGFRSRARPAVQRIELSVSRFSGFARNNVYAGRGHKSRIKADTELADEGGIFLNVLFKLFQKGLCAGPGDGSQVGVQVGFVHTDAAVLYSERFFVFVKENVYARIKANLFIFVFGNRKIFELVQGVRRVRHDFA